MQECVLLSPSTYTRDLMKVIDMLTHRDAVCLARVRLSSSDPVLHKLFTSWAVHMSKDGNYELAAKWLVITDCCHRLTL